MARRKTRKKSSNKLLKTAILLILFIGLWFIYQQPAVQKRINEVLHPRKPTPTAVQTVPVMNIIPVQHLYILREHHVPV